MALLSWDVTLPTSVFMLYCSRWLTPSPSQLRSPRKGSSQPWEVQQSACWASGKGPGSLGFREHTRGDGKPRFEVGSTSHPGKKEMIRPLTGISATGINTPNLDPTPVRADILQLCPYRALPAPASLSPDDSRNAGFKTM